MENKTVKAITYCFKEDDESFEKVVGVYTPDKIIEGLDEIKKYMLTLGHTFIDESKDCCNYRLDFKTKDGAKEYFYTGDYILNEINL